MSRKGANLLSSHREGPVQRMSKRAYLGEVQRRYTDRQPGCDLVALRVSEQAGWTDGITITTGSRQRALDQG